MRTYTMKRIQGVPDWSAHEILPIDNLLWTDSIDVSAQAQICYDEENFYLRLEAVEPHIRMEGKDPLAEVSEDSCLEFFIRPTEREDYFNMEFNPNCVVYLGFGSCLENLIRLIPESMDPLQAQVEFTDVGWVLSYRVPFAFIRRFFPDFTVKTGGKVYANFYKCGDETVKPHYLAWNPITCEEPAFHVPAEFGCLIFGGE